MPTHPLIDRELLFGDPELIDAELSPDGRYVAFLKPWRSTQNIWVKKTGEPFDAARLLTAETKRPIQGYFWTRDSRFILYVKDNDGDENYNVYAVAPEDVPSETGAPPSRDLTALKGVRAEIVSAPKVNPDVIFIVLNDRDPAWHDLYQLRISTGERQLIRKNTERIAAWHFDRQGRLRLAGRVDDNGDQVLLRTDDDGFKEIYRCDVFDSMGVLRFTPDGQRVYLATNKGADVDLVGLVLMDPQTGEIEKVESDPLGRVDLENVVFSEQTDELLYTVYVDEKTRRYFRNRAFEEDFLRVDSDLGGRDLSLESRTYDEQLWLVTAHADTEPGETYLFDRQARKLEWQYRIRERLPREPLAEMQAVRYASSDGLEIPAYLVLPKDQEAKGLPAMIIAHGGPWARDHWGFHSLAQLFANRGYAVLMPNFRGSTGFGKKFLNAGNSEWGRKMQDDLTWGVKYLVNEGIADEKRVGIIGGSYGGYAALAGVAFTPDVYAAAVDIVGPSNLRTLIEAIPPYWEAFRKVMYARMADPNTEEGATWYAERSPLSKAEEIRTPLLVVQGANDPRVHKREAEQIVVALRDRGFPVEYVMAPDEGHGFARPVNNMAMLMVTEKFLAKHVGGRYQEGGTPEVEARVKEIALDPARVVISERVDVSIVGAPKPAKDLRPGTYRYRAAVDIQGQRIGIAQTTTIEDEGGSWVISEVMESPMGGATDRVVLTKGSLLVEEREMSQGPIRVVFGIKGTEATGTMVSDGEEAVIKFQLTGPLFADGGGAAFSIAALPAEKDYRDHFRTFDLSTQKEKVMEVKASGEERVTVPAGTFDSLRMEITAADGGPDRQTIWVDRNTGTPVKVESVLPQMGGAVLTAELE